MDICKCNLVDLHAYLKKNPNKQTNKKKQKRKRNKKIYQILESRYKPVQFTWVTINPKKKKKKKKTHFTQAADLQGLGTKIDAAPHSFIYLHSRTQRLFVVCWLLNVPATCKCISGTDLLRQFYVLPH